MANYTLTPNMNLIQPTPLIQSAPLWATQLNSSLLTVDGHNHSPGQGVLIDPSGLNINLDLSFNQNSAVGVNTVTFFNNPSSLSSSFQGCVYEAGGNFYFNNSAGTAVQITSGSSVVGSSGTITGMTGTTASVVFSSGTGVFTFQQATSTAGNLDIGSLIIRYPGSYPSPSGNYISIQAPTSLASGYVITLPALPAQTNVSTLSAMGVMSSVTWDAVGSNMTSTGANAIAATMTATGANAIQATTTRATGTSVGIGGVAISPSCGMFFTTSSLLTPITNLSVTIVTSGRPVFIGLQSDGSSINQPGFIGCTISTGATEITLYRGSTAISSEAVSGGSTDFGSSPGQINFVDVVAAGTYTYTARAAGLGGGGTFVVFYTTLVAYEL